MCTIMFPSGEYKTFILSVIKGKHQGTSRFLPFHIGHLYKIYDLSFLRDFKGESEAT